MENKKKIIGIPGYRVGENGFGAGANHLEYISHFGVARIIMPWEDYVEVDCLYLAGGLDMDPTDYGQIPGFKTSETDVYKEYFYRHNLKKYIDKKVPVYGVCLGAQQLAVFFGSKLTQHLPLHAQSPDRWQVGHEIRHVSFMGTRTKAEDADKIFVNSHHHQGVTADNLGNALSCLYYAKNEEDKNHPIVEAFAHKELPIIGIQWHPEELYDSVAVELFRTILGE